MKETRFTLFELVSITWIGLAMAALVMAYLGMFRLELLIIILMTLGGFVWQRIRTHRQSLAPMSRQSWIALAIITTVALVLTFTTTPSIFGGRDEGSYSTAAIQLVQDHGLLHRSELVRTFFHIYGPGKALNFPGFFYTDNGALKTQFPPGYISWLGIWYALGRLTGLAFANFLPLLTFVGSFYFILKRLLKKYVPQSNPSFIALGAVLVLLSTFPMVIFYKFTLSELFFGALAWFCLHLLLKYFDHKTSVNYILIFLPLSVMLFTRIEAVGLLVILFIIFLLKDFTHLQRAKYQALFVIGALLFGLSLILNANFFIDTLKNIAEPFLKAGMIPDEKKTFLSDDLKQWYLLKVFWLYHLIPMFLAGTLSLGWLLKKKRTYFLIPFVFFLPTLIYLIDANISLDHPWMLRRFVFSVIPLFLLYAMIGFHAVAQHPIKGIDRWVIPVAACGMLLVFNLVLVFPSFNFNQNYLTFSQSKGLLEKTGQLGILFQPSDLVLVSQRATGTGWSLISEPLRTIYGKQAVYFFNPEDLKKIDRSKFSDVYLVVSANEETLFDTIPKEKQTDLQILNPVFVPSKNADMKPDALDLPVRINVYKLTDR